MGIRPADKVRNLAQHHHPVIRVLTLVQKDVEIYRLMIVLQGVPLSDLARPGHLRLKVVEALLVLQVLVLQDHLDPTPAVILLA
jgi:hypothetical protein